MSSFAYPCPHCGQTYQLDQNYLAQYGGQNTICQHCQQEMPLPTLQQMTAAAPAAPAGAYPPGGYQPAGAYPQAGGYPVAAGGAVLSYAAPNASAGPMSVFRNGNRLVARDGAVLPPMCVKCGQPANHVFRKSFSWHAPAIFLTILAGVLIYVIVALCVRQTARLTFSLCDAHNAKRRNSIVIGWVIFAMGFVMFFLSAMDEFREFQSGFIPLGIIAVIAGLVVVAVGSRIVTPQRIEQKYITLSGVSKRFLAQIPDVYQAQVAQQQAYAWQNAQASAALQTVTE